VLCDDHEEDGGCGEQEDECEPEPVPVFAKTHSAFQAVKSFFYMYIIGEHDEENILNMERVKQLSFFFLERDK
jgi:hypothetical protein